jgi:hypothetical protein
MSPSYSSATVGQERSSGNAPCDLYRFYDASGQLLYVGISLHAAQRASEHRKDKAWWSDVARMEVQHLPTRHAALDAERTAIVNERPLHNVVHNQQRGSVLASINMTDQARQYVGKFIHYDPPGKSTHQAQIVDAIHHAERGTVVVLQYYSWFTGFPSKRASVPFFDLLSFGVTFHDNEDDWVAAGDKILGLS